MYCLKCGEQCQQGQVFCEACTEDMKLHPVKPDAVVQLPPEPQPTKQFYYRPLWTSEEQIRKLTQKNRLLTCLLVITLVLAILFATISTNAVRDVLKQRLKGQNYTTLTQTEPSTPTETE